LKRYRRILTTEKEKYSPSILMAGRNCLSCSDYIKSKKDGIPHRFNAVSLFLDKY